jgi:hypothetical protein
VHQSGAPARWFPWRFLRHDAWVIRENALLRVAADHAIEYGATIDSHRPVGAVTS